MHIHQQVVQQYFCHANYNIKNFLEMIWELKNKIQILKIFKI